MSNTISWINKLINLLKEFARAIFTKSEYEIIDIYECNNTGLIKAQIKLFGRHIIERNIGDIVTDIHFLEGFDKKTVRTLTYMATIDAMKPNYSIVVQQLGNEVDDYVLAIRSRKDKCIIKKSPSEMSKDKELLSRFSPIDANRIGYLAGIKQTVKEFQLNPLETRNHS